MTLDERSATCITLIAEASEENTPTLLGLLEGNAKKLGDAIVAAKNGKHCRGKFGKMAKGLLDLVEKQRRQVEAHRAHRHAGLTSLGMAEA